MMFGCWRKVDATDPDTFITAVAAVLSTYPESIVRRVTDPRFGLPSKQQFPPSAFEVRAECEKHMETIRWHQERNHRLVESSKALALPPPEEKRKSYEQLKELFGPTWGIVGEKIKATDDQIAELLPKVEREAHFEKKAIASAKAFRASPVGLSDEVLAKMEREGHSHQKREEAA